MGNVVDNAVDVVVDVVDEHPPLPLPSIQIVPLPVLLEIVPSAGMVVKMMRSS